PATAATAPPSPAPAVSTCRVHCSATAKLISGTATLEPNASAALLPSARLGSPSGRAAPALRGGGLPGHRSARGRGRRGRPTPSPLQPLRARLTRRPADPALRGDGRPRRTEAVAPSGDHPRVPGVGAGGRAAGLWAVLHPLCPRALHEEGGLVGSRRGRGAPLDPHRQARHVHGNRGA